MSEAVPECWLDAAGNPLKVGDRVAFGSRVGNSGALVLGTIAGFEPHHYHGVVAHIRTDGKRNTARAHNAVVRILAPEASDG